jgi:1-acyl-sn-glycerol-3-phosphate acyltransferase
MMTPVDSPEADRPDARSPEIIAASMPVARALCRAYFRLRVEGLEHLPEGPVLLVGNHNNGLAGPDILCTLSTLWDARGPEAPLYALAHDFAMRQLTAFGAVISRFGALRATRDNARRALGAGASVLVYPGGDLEAYRHFRRRDEVILGPRTGFVTLAREAGVPIVPVVAQGAHRSAVVLHEGEGIARRLGLKRWARVERFPLALALPWGLAAGPWLPWLPLPFSIRLRFLAPRRVDPEQDPAAVRESLRASMQSALHDLARARP